MAYKEKKVVERYVMYNKDEDCEYKRFVLNEEMVSNGVFLEKSVEEAVIKENMKLMKRVGCNTKNSGVKKRVDLGRLSFIL